MARPLIVTARESVRDALFRLAAAAGAEPETADSATETWRRWHEASFVVVDVALVHSVIAAALPRRPGVALLGEDLDDATVWQRAVELGAEHVVFLPDAEPWLVDRLGATRDLRDAVVVGVVGGRGGCGASTLAGALALRAVGLGRSSALVDADPLGGGLDLLLGAEDVPGPRWPDLARSPDRALVGGLASLLPSVSHVPVLSCGREEDLAPRPGQGVAALGALRHEVELVVVDLPRHCDDRAAEFLTSLTTLLLVVPADVRGVAAAARLAVSSAAFVADVRVVVRRPAGGGIAPDFVAATLGLPLAGRFKPERSVAAAGERGLPPLTAGRGHLARLCTSLVRDLLSFRAGRRGAAA